MLATSEAANFAEFSTANASIWGKVLITFARSRAAGDNPSSLIFPMVGTELEPEAFYSYSR